LDDIGEEDLMQAAIFYLDQHYYDKPTYCLLFEGRLIGYSYSNTISEESMSLSFESNLAILNDLSVNFISGAKGKSNKANKDYPSQIDIPTNAKKLLTTSFSGKPISRPFDLVENIIQAVSGEYRDKSSYVEAKDKTLKQKLESLEDLYEGKIRASIAQRITQGSTSSEGEIRKEVELQASRELEDKARSEGLLVSLVSGGVDTGFTDTLARYIAAKKTEEIKNSASNYKDVVLSGFYSRHFRLLRLREHWMCSPYLEGVPDVEDPISGKQGGGVFPLLRSKNAKKYFKGIVKRTGEKMGAGGKAYALLNSLYGMMFYKMAELLAPPCLVVDKYGLPREGLGVSPEDTTFSAYNRKSQLLAKEDKRACIGSYYTAPYAPFAIPPSCNVFFPSTRTSFSMSVSHTGHPTRVYYNRKSPFGRLDLSSKSPGYNHTAGRVGYPSVAAGFAQNAASSGSGDLEFLIFPEEYFRGPAPRISNFHPSYMGIQDFANTARFSAASTEGASPSTVHDADPESLNLAISAAEKMAGDGYKAYGLYFLLAQKEYFEAKARTHTASVNSIFNPYVIVGMPCAVLSGDTSGAQQYGYIHQIAHTINNGGMASTQVTITHVRSIKKDLVKVVADRGATDITPQDPVREIRDLLQNSSSAEEYYRNLLKKEEGLTSIETQQHKATLASVQGLDDAIVEVEYGIEAWEKYKGDEGVLKAGKQELAELKAKRTALKDVLSSMDIGGVGTENSCAFDPKQFLGWWDGEKVKNITIKDSDLSNYLREDTGEPVWGVPANSKLVPLPVVKEYFTDTNKALHYNSRPVCTLEQYIDFYAIAGRGDSGVDPVGRGRGIRVGSQFHSTGAKYYDVVRQFIAGPGVQPGSTPTAAEATVDPLESSLADSTNDDDYGFTMAELTTQADRSLTYIGEDGTLQEYVYLEDGKQITYSDLPDSRKDWQALLLDYLNIVENTATYREG